MNFPRFCLASCSAAALAVTLGWAAPAHANGRFPAASQLVVSPKDHGTLVLRTTYGVLLSKDAGKTWDWICERAVGYGGSEDPSLAMTESNTIVAGTYEGLSLSPDTGCAWSFYGDPLTKKVIVDVVVPPEEPTTVFALGSSYTGADDAGGSLYENRLFSSSDAGRTWAPFGAPIAADVISETSEVAASDPLRFYITAIRGAGATSQGLVYVSTDGAQTWSERTVVGDATSPDREPFLSGVDPTNPDRIYVRTGGTDVSVTVSRLLVSDDAGKTFRTVFTNKPLLGFALSADGSRVFVGSSDGLFSASRDDLTFTKVAPIQIQCLTRVDTHLYACSNEASAGFILGVSDDDGAHFAPVLHLDGLRGPIACAPESAGGRCVADWPPIAEQLGIDAGSDGGADGGGAGSGGGGSNHASCGCSTAGAGAAGALASLGALAALVALALRLRTRPSRGSR